MELAYAAHSARCALLLDAEGICRWFLLKVEDEAVSASAKRCVGAQFVATLDPDAPGLLGPDPAVGKSILFARVDDGRVSLVRFGPLVQFDTLGPSSRSAVESEPPRLALVPTPPTSEPSTLPSASANLTSDDERETQHDLSDDDELATAAAGEDRPYRPSGFAIRAQDPNDGDKIETAAFSRAIVVRASSRRGMLPRRG